MSKLTYRELRDILNGLPAERLETPAILAYYSPGLDETSWASVRCVRLDDPMYLDINLHNDLNEAQEVSND